MLNEIVDIIKVRRTAVPSGEAFTLSECAC
jgi:hypothetical protein